MNQFSNKNFSNPQSSPCLHCVNSVRCVMWKVLVWMLLHGFSILTWINFSWGTQNRTAEHFPFLKTNSDLHKPMVVEPWFKHHTAAIFHHVLVYFELFLLSQRCSVSQPKYGTHTQYWSQRQELLRASPVAAVQVLSFLQDVLLALKPRLAVAHPAGRKEVAG